MKPIKIKIVFIMIKFIVSPYYEKNNKFYNEDEIRELINSKKQNSILIN